MSDKFLALLKSRRFFAAIGGVIFVLTDGLGLDLSQEQINNTVIVIAGWILGDSITKTTK